MEGGRGVDCLLCELFRQAGEARKGYDDSPILVQLFDLIDIAVHFPETLPDTVVAAQ